MEGTTAIDVALSTEGDPDGTDLIEFEEGVGDYTSEGFLSYIKTHEEVAARKLAPPFWGKPFIAWGLAAFIREIQVLEDTLWEMLDLRTVENADLPRLKVLGRIVGQPRLGFGTEAYRTLIRARALANVSRGRASDVFAVLDLLLGENEYELLEVGNATLFLTATAAVSDEGLAMVLLVLPDVRAAGVGLQFLFSDGPLEDVFVWGDNWGTPEEWGSVRSI